MPKNLRISLVIPAYNEEKYIGECLDHALRHSRGVTHAGGVGFHEIIVVDNASTDDTKKVVEKLSDGTIQKIKVVTENKKGLTRARQRGLEEAQGDILAYIDADTHMPPGWLETVAREFARDENLAALSGPYIYHDIPRWQQSLIKALYWRALAMPVYWAVGYMIVGGNFAIRKSVLEKMGGFDTSIAFYGEDTNIARRAAGHGKVKFMPSLSMYTSGRRLKGQGVTKTGLIYIKNFLSEVLFKKPATTEYRDIR